MIRPCSVRPPVDGTPASRYRSDGPDTRHDHRRFLERSRPLLAD